MFWILLIFYEDAKRARAAGGPALLVVLYFWPGSFTLP
jgi:hypothetical protein